MAIRKKYTRGKIMKKRIIRKCIFQRVLLCILLAFVCVLPTNIGAAENKYPSRYIELYHGFPGGGPVEVQNRLLAKSLEKQLGNTVVSVGKPGGGGIVATTALINSAPDGYTLANAGYNSIVQTILTCKRDIYS